MLYKDFCQIFTFEAVAGHAFYILSVVRLSFFCFDVTNGWFGN